MIESPEFVSIIKLIGENMRLRNFIISISIILYAAVAFAGEDATKYAQARKMAKAGQKDFAFMQYQTILRDYPNSRFTEPALFGKGEYYFLIEDYRQAKEAFEGFLTQFPKSNGRMFALAYLWRIAKLQNDEATAQDLANQIVTQKQVSLVFRDRKEYKYLSPLNNNFLAAIHIDKIEVYLGGELFAKISY
jgi:hypothetical protein